jgi:hypothetical protein
VFDGFEIGGAMRVGHTLAESSPSNPVREAFRLFFHGQYGDRPSWDETAVLFAVRGLGGYWGEVHTGHNDIAQDGANTWRPENVAGKDHAYLVPKMPTTELAREIESLLAEPPRRR